MRGPLEQRFWAKVERLGPDDCWVWTAAKAEFGYGLIQVQSPDGSWTLTFAHRVSARLAGMHIDGYAVLHSCDNPPCVNPSHLRPGTLRENTADMLERKRHYQDPWTRMSRPKVEAIIARLKCGQSNASIASEFGVSRRCIARIAAGDSYRDISGGRRIVCESKRHRGSRIEFGSSGAAI